MYQFNSVFWPPLIDQGAAKSCRLPTSYFCRRSVTALAIYVDISSNRYPPNAAVGAPLFSLNNFLSTYTVDHCSDEEADTELSSGGVRAAQAGVRSFGIDDILGHTSVTSVARRGAGLGRSPLDALFTMTTNFDSLKQKSGALR